MRRTPISFWVFLGSLLVLTARAGVADQVGGVVHKHALLVAVNGYERPNGNGAEPLNTSSDVRGIAAALESRWGFEDITVLKTPTQTTRNAILAAFQTLIQKTEPGDIVYFHYSGHGTQTPDPQSDTLYDQALVPSDYYIDNPKNDITNRDIHKLLEELKTKEPGSVLLTFDCCHSGIMTRGGCMLCRQYERANMEQLSSLHSNKSRQIRGSFITSLDATQLGYTVISACRDDQVDVETEDDSHPAHLMGSLSYALVHALSEANERSTYRDLLYRIQSTLLAKGIDDQDPQMDGNPDQLIFDGKIEQASPSILVDIDVLSEPFLKAGSLMGVAKGTELNIYSRDTKEFNTAFPIATAEVTETEPTISDLKVTIKAGHSFDDLRDARAVVTKRRYLMSPLVVDESGVSSGQRRQEISQALQPLITCGSIILNTTPGKQSGFDLWIGPVLPPRQKHPAIIPIPPPCRARSADIVIERQDGSFLIVRNDAGDYVQLLGADPDFSKEIATAVQYEARLRVLNTLVRQNPDASDKVEMQIIPCKVDANGVYSGDLANKDLPGLSAVDPTIPENTHFRVELKNIGDKTVYVNILDIASDGSIRPFWPDPRIALTPNAIKSGGEHTPWMKIYRGDGKTYQTWHLTKPFGEETYLVLATEKPADFSPLFADTARGVEPRSTIARAAATLPLGQLLESVMANTRSSYLDVGDWSAWTIMVDVARAGGALTRRPK